MVPGFRRCRRNGYDPPMNWAARFETVTAPDWSELADELDAWTGEGTVARLWWRDDDAVEPTGQLEALIDCANGVPLGLAVIPASATRELADFVAGMPAVTVLQHGWRHTDHGSHDVGGKKSEFPASRVPAEVLDELAAGRARLAELFGEQFLPVLAPPWNRFAAEFEPLLAEAGLLALSGLARPSGGVAHRAGTIDVHVDLVDWRGRRGFIGDAAALDGLVRALQAQRLGSDPGPGIGLLTHHLVMDAATADFLSDLLDRTRGHAAVRWVGPSELLAPW